MLTYQQVRHERIDVDAQRSLMRMSNNPQTAVQAEQLNAEVHAGRLWGIFAEDQREPAKRALVYTGGWWLLIPKGSDAVVVLSEKNESGGPPLIAFRRGIRNDPARLDAALLKAFRTYQQWRDGTIVKCDGLLTETADDVVPTGYCRRLSTLRTVRCACTGTISLLQIWVNAFIPSGPVLIQAGPFLGSTAVPAGPGRGLVSDDRGFNNSFAPFPSSRFTARVDIPFPDQIAIPPATGVPRGADFMVALPTGALACASGPKAPTTGFARATPTTTSGLTSLTVPLAVADPNSCISGFATAATGTLIVSYLSARPSAVKIQLFGTARAFALEAYVKTAAGLGSCTTPILQDVLGSTQSVASVAAGPPRPFRGEVNIQCVSAEEGLRRRIA